MHRPAANRFSRLLVLSAGLGAALSACTTTPAATSTPAVGQQATVEGQVVSVDTAPWAYDGNAVLTVQSTAAGTVNIQFPARWNLCKAQQPTDLQTLAPGQRVQATGEITDAGVMVVCALPTHGLRILD